MTLAGSVRDMSLLAAQWTLAHRRWHTTGAYNGQRWHMDQRGDLGYIYNHVKVSGIPNAMGACIPVPYRLNIKAWEKHLGDLGDRNRVLDFVKYACFPTVSDTAPVPNHSSATQLPHDVKTFFDEELALKGVVGPFPTHPPPFKLWCHASHLMTRQKSAGVRDMSLLT